VLFFALDDADSFFTTYCRFSSMVFHPHRLSRKGLSQVKKTLLSTPRLSALHSGKGLLRFIPHTALVVLSSAPMLSHAQSSVTLFGIVDDGLQYLSGQGVAQSTGSAGHPVAYRNSSSISMKSGAHYGDRWGFLGTEDLGDGNSAVFRLENGFNINTGASSNAADQFSREAWVGLENKRFGRLTFGRQYEATTDLLEIYGNDFGTGAGTYPGDMSNLDDSIRINNSVKYISNDLGGFTLDMLYGFGGAAGSVGSGSSYAGGFKYVNGPFGGGVTYQHYNNAYTAGNTWSGSADANFGSSPTAGYAGARSVQIVSAVSQYKLGEWTVGLNAAYTQYKPSLLSSFKKTEAYDSVGGGAKYNISPALWVGASYSYTLGQSVSTNAARPQYHSVATSMYYALSKRTQLYAIVAYQHTKGKTFDAYGNVVDTTASIGDSANGASSASGNQFLIRVGLANRF
jgi:predicted porin